MYGYYTLSRTGTTLRVVVIPVVVVSFDFHPIGVHTTHHLYLALSTPSLCLAKARSSVGNTLLSATYRVYFEVCTY